jgi:hypothetical protein
MDRAVTAAGEAELTDAQSLVEESAFALSFYAGAAGNYADANLLRDRGEDARADDFERDGDNAYSSARGRPVHAPTTVDGRLGL